MDLRRFKCPKTEMQGQSVVGGYGKFNNEKIGALQGIQYATLVKVSSDPDRLKLMTRMFLLKGVLWLGGVIQQTQASNPVLGLGNCVIILSNTPDIGHEQFLQAIFNVRNEPQR